MASIIVPRRKEDWFTPDGNFTHQAFRFFEELTNVTNEVVIDIDTNASVSGFSAQVQQLRKELDGLPEFTMDTEGFTMDTTDFTMDKVIA